MSPNKESENLPGFESLIHGTYQTSTGSNLSFYYTHPKQFEGQHKPVMLLTHGYPENSFIWRHHIPTLSKRLPLFVPDQPGYGQSTASTTGIDKLTMARAIAESLLSIYGPTKVILGGHDRGGRTMQRLAVSRAEFGDLDVLGLIVFDIVPFVAEFASFSNPLLASGYFHWSFLPVDDLSYPMIMAYGGGKFIEALLRKGAGTNPDGLASFKADGAWERYVADFDKASVTKASVEDYKAGATLDYDAMTADQDGGRKIGVRTRVVYSERNLGRQFGDLYAVWKPYMAEGVKLDVHGIGEDRGHFIVEEAPTATLALIEDFLEEFGY
ncbi:hypothetical protein MMC25_007589 [Agyrium rufum]|nr:hypothetical protein [Agyrium rufum]